MLINVSRRNSDGAGDESRFWIEPQILTDIHDDKLFPGVHSFAQFFGGNTLFVKQALQKFELDVFDEDVANKSTYE